MAERSNKTREPLLSHISTPMSTMTPGTGAAHRITTATAVYQYLHAAIVAVEIPPGSPINDKILKERFGISRTPVREALLRLAEEGLVDIFPQSGTFVSRISMRHIPEAVIIRQALEGATVQLAANNVTRIDIETLDENLARQAFFEKRRDLNAFHETDETFHQLIARISGHIGIWDYLKPAKLQIDRARRLTLPSKNRMESIIEEHKRIRNAIANRNPKGAYRAMMKHLESVIPDVDKIRSVYPEYFF